MILIISNEIDTSDKKHVKRLGRVFNLSSDIRAATISSRWVIWEYNQYHVPRQPCYHQHLQLSNISGIIHF